MHDGFYFRNGFPRVALRGLAWAGGILGGMVCGFTVGFLAGRKRESGSGGSEAREPELMDLNGWDWYPQSGAVTYSRRWAATFGYKLEEIEPTFRFFIRHVHPDDRPVLMELLTRHLEGHSPGYESEHRIRTKTGQWKWVLDRGQTVERDAAGHPLRVSGICLDISDRRWAVEALEKRALFRRVDKPVGELRFEDLFDLDEIQKIQDAFAEATGVASIITDTQGRPITRPSHFCKLCMLIRSTTKGAMNCFKSDATLGRSNAKGTTIAPCLSGGLFDGSANIFAGERHIANWLIGQVRDETIKDATLMRYAGQIGADEEAYRRALAEVPQMSRTRFARIGEVLYLIAGQLSKLALQNMQQGRAITELERVRADLEKAKNMAEAASRAKDDFLAVLSHELRTPLTAVLGAVGSLHEEARFPGEFREDLEMIRRNVGLEARLIDDLLDVTRISKGKIEMSREVVDVHGCLRSALEICEGDLREKKQRVKLHLEAPRHYVMGDPARLQQVFWNLLKNAVKFTPAEGLIWVRTFNQRARDEIRDHGERLVVEVADNGIGIDSHHLSRIFNAFEQVDGSRRFGGLGLGLSIAKAVVELHHGTLTASSEGRGKGATFTVVLETADAPMPEPAAAPGPSPASGGHAVKVLLVEDHPDTLRILARMLEKWGYVVTAASSVRGALESAEKEEFDVLVSDLGLPDGSGLELMRELRALRPGRPLPGIALSGYGAENDLRQSREAGFEEHLVKPVGVEGLRQSLQRITAREETISVVRNGEAR